MPSRTGKFATAFPSRRASAVSPTATPTDVQELKRRGRGRPGRGAEPMQVVAVRLTAEELAAVDAIAERDHISRSEAIRRALAGFAA